MKITQILDYIVLGFLMLYFQINQINQMNQMITPTLTIVILSGAVGSCVHIYSLYSGNNDRCNFP